MGVGDEAKELLRMAGGRLVISEGAVAPQFVADYGVPAGMVNMHARALQEEWVGERDVLPGAVLILFRQNTAMTVVMGVPGHLCLSDGVLVVAAFAMRYRPTSVALVSSGLLLPDAKDMPDDIVEKLVVAAGKGSEPAGNVQVTRVITVAARNIQGDVALSIFTPMLRDGVIAGFLREDMPTEEILAGGNPCMALEAMFLWRDKERKG